MSTQRITVKKVNMPSDPRGYTHAFSWVGCSGSVIAWALKGTNGKDTWYSLHKPNASSCNRTNPERICKSLEQCKQAILDLKIGY